MQAKKSLGQNFLQDTGIIDRIIEAADIGQDDAVLEIGPGTGALTKKLSEKAKQVIAIELDKDLIPGLLRQFPFSSNVSVIEGDILKTDVSKILLGKQVSGYKVVANIPYYITAPIIRKLLGLTPAPSEIILMVQKEVAERVTALPGDMSILAVATQRFATPEYLFTVPRSAFQPVPQVDSAIIRLIPKDDISPFPDDKDFFRLVKIGFSSRRKTLANNLANGLHIPKENVLQALGAIGLKESVRAQELSLEQWDDLVRQFSEHHPHE